MCGHHPTRVTLVISSLGPGGAERVLCSLANGLANVGHAVTILTFSQLGNDFYRLDGKIERIGLGLLRASNGVTERLMNIGVRLHRIRAGLRTSRPDIVVSFMDTTNIITLLASVGLSVPVVVAERNDPTQQRLSPVQEVLRKVTYRRAAALVMQTEATRAWAESIVPNRCSVIPNPITLQRRERAAQSPGQTHRMAAMGRLTNQKGFDLLIEAFAKCSPTNPSWELVIAGEGEERQRLESLALQHNLENHVTLPGVVRDVAGFMASAEIFVLSSRYEGFPNVLVEAMACGLCCIASNCRSGPAEIVRHGVDGLLVAPQDVDALATAMSAMMRAASERRRLGENAVRVTDRFSMDRFITAWVDLLASTIG